MELQSIQQPENVPNPGRKEKAEQDALAKEVEQDSNLHTLAHWWKRVLLGFSFLALVAVILIRVYFLLSPHSFHWLSDEEITRIDEFFVHGTIGVIIAGYMGKYLSGKHK